MSEEQALHKSEKVEWRSGGTLHHGTWKLVRWAMTTTGLGLQIDITAPNTGTSSCLRHLLDLLDLIREIALQSDCLMPIVAQVPKKIEAVKDLARKQHEHHGRYLLMSDDGSNNLDDLLATGGNDIKITPPGLKSFAEFLDKAREELDKPLVDKIVSLRSRAQTGDKREIPSQEKPKQFGRIKAVRIENFKGIQKLGVNNTLSLDADIILVTGANGQGKSSFVEALSLALSGYHPEWPASKDPLPDHFFHKKAEEFSIILTMEERDEKGMKSTEEEERPENMEISFQGSRTDKPAAHFPLLCRWQDAGDGQKFGWMPVDNKLSFRLTTYLPDHVGLLFDPDEKEKKDDEEEEKTIADLFPTLPEEAKLLRREVNSRISTLEEEQNTYNSTRSELEKNWQQLRTNSREFFNGFTPLLQDWTRSAGLDSPRKLPDWDAAQSFAEFGNLLDELVECLRPALGDIKTWNAPELEEHLRKTTEKAAGIYKDGKILSLVEEIEDLVRKRQGLEEKIDDLAESAERLVPLLDTFNWLSDEQIREEALGILQEMGMDVIGHELGRVKPERARNYANQLENAGIRYKKELETSLARVVEELAAKEEEREILIRQTETYKKFKKLIDYIREDGHQNYLADLDQGLKTYKRYKKQKSELAGSEEELESLNTLADFIQEQASDPKKFRENVQKSLNQVLKRYVLAHGLEEVKVEGDHRFSISDKDNLRDSRYFSSGQKAQMAMAWLVACRELVHNRANQDLVHFPHRVMIMDDPSTTFDLSNLHSQAILWRQLAYNPNPKERYQVFIVSHHEEFSARLLDLLCPPGVDGSGAECRMKLLRFTKWSPEEGAQIECFDVQPQPRSLEKAKDTFQVGIKLLGEEI